MTKLIDPISSVGMKGAMKQAMSEHQSMMRGDGLHMRCQKCRSHDTGWSFWIVTTYKCLACGHSWHPRS